MNRYAENTKVSKTRSLQEIQDTLKRYGADGFQFGIEGSRAMIGFKLKVRIVRMQLIMPDPEAKEFWATPKGQTRKDSAAEAVWKQACKQKWRALALVVKSKLESMESGIETFDEAFFAHIVIPGKDARGMTIGESMIPQLSQALEGGPMLKLLPGGYSE